MKIAVRRTLALAVASSLALSLPAVAGDLTPGQSATVQPGDLPETWQLNNAELIVNPGGKALEIEARAQSRLNITGAEMSAAVTFGGISLSNSTLTLTNSAVVNAGGRGISLAAAMSSGLPGSIATISNSHITGLGTGISVVAMPGPRAVLNLDRSQVTGKLNLPPLDRSLRATVSRCLKVPMFE